MDPSLVRYAITDRTLFRESSNNDASCRAALIQQAARLAANGVDFLQLREKDLSAGDLADLARTLLEILRHSSTRLLINSRADLAVAVGAPGVHLTAAPGELTPVQVRTLYAQSGLPVPFVSIACHRLDELAHNREQPLGSRPDAILFSPVFEKSVAGRHLTGGTGLTLLEQACAAAAPIPVLALGGITPANVTACIQAGAAGVAGIRLFQQPW